MFAGHTTRFTKEETKMFVMEMIRALAIVEAPIFIQTLSRIFHSFVVNRQSMTTSEYKSVDNLFQKLPRNQGFGEALPWKSKAGLYYRDLYSIYPKTRKKAQALISKSIDDTVINGAMEFFPQPLTKLFNRMSQANVAPIVIDDIRDYMDRLGFIAPIQDAPQMVQPAPAIDMSVIDTAIAAYVNNQIASKLSTMATTFSTEPLDIQT